MLILFFCTSFPLFKYHLHSFQPISTLQIPSSLFIYHFHSFHPIYTLQIISPLFKSHFHSLNSISTLQIISTLFKFHLHSLHTISTLHHCSSSTQYISYINTTHSVQISNWFEDFGTCEQLALVYGLLSRMDVVRNRFLLTSDLGTCCMTNGGGGGDNAQSRANDSSLYNCRGVASEIIGVACEWIAVFYNKKRAWL